MRQKPSLRYPVRTSSSAVKGLETEHRSREAFYGPMVLFDDIVDAAFVHVPAVARLALTTAVIRGEYR
ncbi:hypothetical protein AAKU64_004580 [Undibacterium sp. GrIS 1.8]